MTKFIMFNFLSHCPKHINRVMFIFMLFVFIMVKGSELQYIIMNGVSIYLVHAWLVWNVKKHWPEVVQVNNNIPKYDHSVLSYINLLFNQKMLQAFLKKTELQSCCFNKVATDCVNLSSRLSILYFTVVVYSNATILFSASDCCKNGRLINWD